MKKISKVISAVLITALIATVISVSVIAAEPASITVKTAPARTVYYEGVDIFDGMLFCDPTGLVVTVTNADGTTFDVSADDGMLFMDIEEYVLGENTATVYYLAEDGETELTTTLPITVKESPVADIKITKMPDKTVYDMDKDVLTPENFSFDRLYETDPESFDAILGEMGLTYEELKEVYDDPEMGAAIKEIMFEEYKNILLIDTTGMEIEVEFKDGTSQTLTDEQSTVIYDGVEIPVLVDQPAEIKEGVNTLYITVADVQTSFDVTVKKSAQTATPEKPIAKPDKPVDNKNPEIPNTDGGVSLAAVAVISLVSGLGIALVPSKKKEQF